MPCCKLLRATVTSDAKIVQVASKNFLPAQIAIIAEIIFANQARLHRTPLELDIGPPFVDSFAESVLQRSILRSRSTFSRLTTEPLPSQV